MTVEIGINDLFVPQNQGAWLWQLTKEGSRMIQESRFIAKGENGGPDDLGAYRVAVRIPDTGAGGEDPVWGVY